MSLLSAVSVHPNKPTRQWFGWFKLNYAIFFALAVYAIIVPLIAPDSAIAVNPARRFQPPFGATLLGTDHLGRDLGVLVAQGLRMSLLLALSVVAIGALLGWIVGACSAYLGGYVDGILNRIMDAFNAFPGIVLAIALTTALGSSIPTLIAVLVAATWVNYARVVRARVLSLKSEEYVVASRMYGASLFRVLTRHIWPNTADLLLSVALAQVANVMLAEATISFLGFGLQPPEISLGLLISSEKDYLQTNGYPVLLAGAVLMIACASLTTAALALRKEES
ncbi:MAG TPA: ABC transporter permease [Devosia sp.]|nr:ABC transporter permease [Devosia sp.]